MEGKRAGIEEELVVLLGEYRLSGEGTRPVTYAGGIRSLEDLELVKQLGKGQVIFTDSRLFFLATKIMIIIIITLRCVMQSPSIFFLGESDPNHDQVQYCRRNILPSYVLCCSYFEYSSSSDGIFVYETILRTLSTIKITIKVKANNPPASIMHHAPHNG